MKKSIFRFRTIILVFIFFTACQITVKESIGQIPTDNLAYPVLVHIGPSLGSGFYYRIEEKIFFVTARHVLYKRSEVFLEEMPKGISFPERLLYKLGYDSKKKLLYYEGVMHEKEKDALLALSKDKHINSAIENLYKKTQELQLHSKTAKLFSYPRDVTEESYNEMTINFDLLSGNIGIEYHKFHDVAIIQIGHTQTGPNGSLSLSQGIELNRASKSGLVLVSQDNTKSFEDVSIGNDIFLFGFPSSLGIKTPQFDIKTALLRKGVVAGKNTDLKTIILDCPVHPGNSGGPVIEVSDLGFSKKYRLIGIAIQFVPAFERGIVDKEEVTTITMMANSGYSVAVPVDAINELVESIIHEL